MKSLWQEFRTFAFKGNMIDLAIAVVIGGAFAKVVDALVKQIVMPLVGYVLPGKGGYTEWKLGEVAIGAFLGELVNFVVVAAAVFIFMVKVLGFLMRMRKAEEAPAVPTTKECPMCCSVIPIKAVKCAHCTSDLASAHV